MTDVLDPAVKKEIEDTIHNSLELDKKNAGKFSMSEILDHQRSCSCPDCPMCSAVRERVNDSILENNLKNTISRAQKVVKQISG